MQEKAAYSTKYHPNNHELVVAGSLRPGGNGELDPLHSCLAEAMADARGVLYFNFKRLRQLNHAGFAHIARMVRQAATAREDLDVKLVVSSVTPWAVPRFKHLASLWPNVDIKQYDRAFYPGQQVIDSDELIPVLRAQTELLWQLEKRQLEVSGLRPGMRVADICCGIGDFAVLLRKTFNPETIIGVDHSQRFLDYGNSVLEEFRLDNIEYRFGDATHLLLPNNSFDFVMCRLSLQIFDQPEQIARELYRICKPGGTVYITNELMSHNVGFPHRESIELGYRLWSEMFRQLNIDMEFGPKAAVFLKDEGFENVRIEALDFNNTTCDPEDFARVVESWVEYATETVAPATAAPADRIEAMRSGLEDFIVAIRHRRGFASWPVYVATARKPER